VTRLSEEEIAAALARVPNWKRDGDDIKRMVVLKNFREALSFVVHVGCLAEKANHHPDIEIHYKSVLLTLSTHDANGLTEKDFKLAEQIEQIL
jgi:4a-hydroxytetrahydrobiopterin dehydratase